MPGADKAYRTDGVVRKMPSQSLVEREEWRLHCLHKEAVLASGSGEDFRKLAHVERRWFLAKNVLASGERADAELGMRVGMRGHIDGIDVCSKELVYCGRYARNSELFGVGAGAVRASAPYRNENGVWNRRQPLGEARRRTSWTENAEADLTL